VPRVHDGDHAFILQNEDNRIAFVIPYERDFSLIGTTDIPVEAGENPVCTPDEIAYLCELASHYMAKPVRPEDVVWTYSGVRPLFDDGDDDPSAVTRDYHLEVDAPDGAAPILSVFGGKITTYRRLAEAALAKLRPYLESMGAPWTAGAPLPGGDRAVDGVDAAVTRLCSDRPFLDERWARRLVRSYGSQVGDVLGAATSTKDLGTRFGWDLTEAEVSWLMRREWAQTADDVLWRRSKLGLRLVEDEARNLDAWMRERQARTLSDSAQ
jgi:glycerol-3-phosphate dehydrogenase